MPSPISTELFRFDMDACGVLGEVAGVDEAGRGCLAGPIVAAAVVFDYSGPQKDYFASLLERLNDSKKLSAAAREIIYPFIIRVAARFSIAIAGSRTIDEKGLHKTNLFVLERCLARLSPCPEIVLVDGYKIPLSDCTHRSIKKGDSRSACIAAASIIAKVSRDRIMQQMDGKYPQYGFKQHMGYATKNHREAIGRHGYCDIHRRSFNISLPQTLPGKG